MTAELDAWERRGIAASLAANGFLRRSPWSDGGRPGHREWLHFTVHTEELRLVINASIVDDLRPAAPGHRERVRVVVLARDVAGWRGGVEDIADAQLDGGQLAARLGGLVIESQGGTITLRGTLAGLGIELDLVLEARTFPSLATGVALGESPPINWLVVPHLDASGRVVLTGRVHDVDGASAYHDHNWGFFSHHDLAWQWGHAGGRGPHCAVLTRLLDAAHTSTYLQALLVWTGPRQTRVFRGGELHVEPEGFLRPQAPFTVPRAAALLVQDTATEIPRVLHIAAAAGRDAIEGAFECETVARIVVPHDDGLATTVIHEVDGRMRLHGTLHGAPFELDAPAMFEFLRGVG